MKAFLRAFAAFLRVEMAVMAQYRAEMALWALWGVAYPAVAIAMWGSAARSGSADGALHGFGPRDFAAYFLLTMIVGHCVAAWDIYEMSHLVRSGAMSGKLLRPVAPVWEHVASNLMFKMLTLLLLLPIWLVVALATKPEFQLTWSSVVAGTVATVLAAAVNFIWGFTTGLAAFWFSKAEGIGEVWFGMSLFFGGRLAPLALLPVPLQWIAAALPYKWVIWFPSEALMGRVNGAELALGLLWQTCWLVGGLGMFRLLWPMSVKRYSAVGA